MTKKLLLVLIILILVPILFINVVNAAQAPVSKSGKKYILREEPGASVKSCRINFDTKTLRSSVSIDLELYNAGDEELSLMMGMPVNYDNFIKVENLNVWVGGSKANPAAVNFDNGGIPNIPAGQWLIWNVKIAPNSYKTVSSTFTLYHPKLENGTQKLLVPLELLKHWKGDIPGISVTLNVDGLPLYGINPKPSKLPDNFDEDGKLTWYFKNVITPGNLDVFYMPVSYMITSFFNNAVTSQDGADAIIESYSKGHFGTTAAAIDAFIGNNPGYERRDELIFIKGLCQMELLEFVSSAETFRSIEDMQIFYHQDPQYDISAYMKNVLMYNSFKTLLHYDNTTMAYEYLEKAIQTTDSTTYPMLYKWMEEELILADPPSPTPSAAPQSSSEEEVVIESEDSILLPANTIKIFKWDIRVEFVFGTVLILVILIIVSIIRRRSRRRRGSIFR